MVNMPSVLLEVKARDQNAQISGYLQTHTSKSKRWKKRWYVVYNLVLYEFERHEVRSVEFHLLHIIIHVHTRVLCMFSINSFLCTVYIALLMLS